MIAARSAVITARAASAENAADPLAIKAAGLAAVVLFSAVFWVALVFAAGYLFGYTLHAKTLATLGCSIAAFLTVVCAPIMLRP